MVQNKSQGQNGLNDTRKGNQQDSKQANKMPDRSLENEQRENNQRPGKTGQGRKTAGKSNNH